MMNSFGENSPSVNPRTIKRDEISSKYKENPHLSAYIERGMGLRSIRKLEFEKVDNKDLLNKIQSQMVEKTEK